MIFVDSWAWLALAYKKDPYHAIATRQHQAFQAQGHRYVTTDFVLSELMTLLFGVTPFGKAERFVQDLLRSAQTGRYRLEFVTPDQFYQAWALRRRYHDKPDISFVDLTSMVVMQDLAITNIFTGDAHFRQVNLGFRLFP
jgi:predicted nucleic acid-binding protein